MRYILLLLLIVFNLYSDEFNKKYYNEACSTGYNYNTLTYNIQKISIDFPGIFNFNDSLLISSLMYLKDFRVYNGLKKELGSFSCLFTYRCKQVETIREQFNQINQCETYLKKVDSLNAVRYKSKVTSKVFLSSCAVTGAVTIFTLVAGIAKLIQYEPDDGVKYIKSAAVFSSISLGLLIIGGSISLSVDGKSSRNKFYKKRGDIIRKVFFEYNGQILLNHNSANAFE